MGFYIDMINVGQGDSFLLTLDSSTAGIGYVLIDGGPAKTSDTLVKHLQTITSGCIHLLIVTHLDADHIGGLKAVLEKIDVKNVMINIPGNMNDWLSARDRLKEIGKKVESIRKIEENISTANELFDFIIDKDISFEPALAGKAKRHGEDIELKILNPTNERLQNAWADELLKETVNGLVFGQSDAPSTSPRNNASVVMELVYKGSPYALFTADAGADVIKEVTRGQQYEFLKLPHHGGKTGMDEELIKQISPKTVYLPVGENPHGHPATEVLDMIKKVGAKTYCSNRTTNCRRACSYQGFGNICHLKDKDGRPDWNTVDSKKCVNNQ
ncbi:ComEC/Rec2 family competence protein [Candidatus Omnitrophota bacterium]